MQHIFEKLFKVPPEHAPTFDWHKCINCGILATYEGYNTILDFSQIRNAVVPCFLVSPFALQDLSCEECIIHGIIE